MSNAPKAWQHPDPPPQKNQPVQPPSHTLTHQKFEWELYEKSSQWILPKTSGSSFREILMKLQMSGGEGGLFLKINNQGWYLLVICIPVLWLIKKSKKKKPCLVAPPPGCHSPPATAGKAEGRGASSRFGNVWTYVGGAWG